MAAVREKLLTASDLAALCEVDLKTIHNWVDRGRIAHFRTPGRHLRFRAADVAEFLRAWGYSVPRELARQSARTILVAGTKDSLAAVTKALGEGAPAGAGAGPPGQPAPAGTQPIRLAAHPYDALIFAGSDPADVYVVDARAVSDDIDPVALLEALHRASPEATFAVLSEDAASVPSFATRIGRGDAAALKKLLTPEPAAAPPKAVPAAAGSGSGSKIAEAPAEETPPRVAGGGRGS